jgi:hypothetical protein
MIAHNVYFTLHDNRPAAVRALIDDCHRYLAPMPGIVFYAVGTPLDADPSSTDRGFDVALHVVFQDRAALDAYMSDPAHVELIAKHESNWKDIQGFDSSVSGPE